MKTMTDPRTNSRAGRLSARARASAVADPGGGPAPADRAAAGRPAHRRGDRGLEPAQADLQRRVARRDRELQPERAGRAGRRVRRHPVRGRLQPRHHGRGRRAARRAQQTHLSPGEVSSPAGRDPRPGQPVPAHPGDRPDGAGGGGPRVGRDRGADGLHPPLRRRRTRRRPRLLARFRAAQAKAETAATAVDRAKRAVTASPDSNSARNRLEKAQTDSRRPRCGRAACAAAYLEQAQNTTSGIPVRVLNQADAAASDAGQKLRAAPHRRAWRPASRSASRSPRPSPRAAGAGSCRGL